MLPSIRVSSRMHLPDSLLFAKAAISKGLLEFSGIEWESDWKEDYVPEIDAVYRSVFLLKEFSAGTTPISGRRGQITCIVERKKPKQQDNTKEPGRSGTSDKMGWGSESAQPEKESEKSSTASAEQKEKSDKKSYSLPSYMFRNGFAVSVEIGFRI